MQGGFGKVRVIALGSSVALVDALSLVVAAGELVASGLAVSVTSALVAFIF